MRRHVRGVRREFMSRFRRRTPDQDEVYRWISPSITSDSSGVRIQKMM